MQKGEASRLWEPPRNEESGTRPQAPSAPPVASPSHRPTLSNGLFRGNDSWQLLLFEPEGEDRGPAGERRAGK